MSLPSSPPWPRESILAAARAMAGGAGFAPALLAALTSPHADSRQVVAAIHNAPGIALRVLKVANSAFYGCSGRVDALPHKIEIFLHLVDVKLLRQTRDLGGPVEAPDVVAHIGEGDRRDGAAGENFAALPKNPWVTDGVAADHHPRGLRLRENGGGLGRRGDVAVGQDGAARAGDRAGDKIVVDLAAIHFFDRAPVDTEQVNAGLVDEIEDAVER